MRSNASSVSTSVSAARPAAIESALPNSVPPVATSSTKAPATTLDWAGGAISAPISSVIP